MKHPATWSEWSRSRDLLLDRLGRLIRNTSRLSDPVFHGILARIDRDGVMLDTIRSDLPW